MKTQLNVGDSIIYDGMVCRIVEIDEEDNSLKLWTAGNEDGFWVDDPRTLTAENGIVKRSVIIEIEVDTEAIKEKYPNYAINYDNPDQLIDAIIANFKTEGGVRMDIDGMDSFGYSINVYEQ